MDNEPSEILDEPLLTLKDFHDMNGFGSASGAMVKQNLRAEAIRKVKRIRELKSKIGHNSWCPSFYGEEDGVMRYDALSNIERYILWQNNLTEDDIKEV